MMEARLGRVGREFEGAFGLRFEDAFGACLKESCDAFEGELGARLRANWGCVGACLRLRLRAHLEGVWNAFGACLRACWEDV
jgi:hypothetical protein